MIPGTRAGETASTQVRQGSLRGSTSGQCSRGGLCAEERLGAYPLVGAILGWVAGRGGAVRVKRVRARCCS